MQTLSIGREPSNNIILNDTFVSRKHAQLVISDNGQVMLRDLGSSNGTFVNGNRIRECYLNPGDTVKCAAVHFNWTNYVPNYSVNSARSVSAESNTGARKSESSQFQNKQIFPIDTPEMSSKLPDDNSAPKGLSGNQQAKQLSPSPQLEAGVLPMQQNVIVMGKAKSVGTAFLLAFFFGPLGLLYATVTGGVIMFFLAIPIIIFTAFIGIFFINPICSIWAVIAANQANAALQNKAGGLINNNFQR